MHGQSLRSLRLRLQFYDARRRTIMRTAFLMLLVGCLLFPCAVIAGEPATQPPVRILVPAYFYPSRDGLTAWKELLSSASAAPVVAIVNPASGPGRRVDPNYEEVFRLAKSSKATLIGYVTLSYAKRPAAEVKAEIDTWVKFYPRHSGDLLRRATQPGGASSFLPGVLRSCRGEDRPGADRQQPRHALRPRVWRTAAEAGARPLRAGDRIRQI